MTTLLSNLQAPSPQAGDGSSKSSKDKEKDKEKDKSTKEKSNLQVAGNAGEITAGMNQSALIIPLSC